MLIEQPILPGDIIEFANTRGTVRRIGARSTHILTPENLDLVVPNSALLENSITNWTLRDNSVRRTMRVGVAYGSPTRQVEKLLYQSLNEDERILKNPPPSIFFADFGNSALQLEIRFWMQMRQLTEAWIVESELRHRIDENFRKEGIVIAFPQRDIHLHSAEHPLKVEVIKST